MNLINTKDSIFIAGHTGMVGSSIKRYFHKKGYKNLILPTRNDLDLSNAQSVEKWFKNNSPEIVILAAAKVGGIEANSKYPADFILENIKIQTNIIENSWRKGIKRFLFLGSSCIYPKYAPQPIKEEYLLNGALEPTNEAYAIAKISGIKLCSALRKQYGFDAISLMPTNLYGPGDNYNLNNSHVMPALIRKFYNAKINHEKEVVCWGTGSPKREFLYVDDLAEASLFALEKISSQNELLNDKESEISGIINIGTGFDISIKDLTELIAHEFNYQGNIIWDDSKPDGTPRKLLDVSRVNSFGWVSKTSLKNGIKMTIDNFIKDYKSKTLRI